MSQERDQAYFDIFTTAIEGGINYWAEIESYHCWLGSTEFRDLQTFSAEVFDPDSEKWFTVNRATIAKGVGKFTENRADSPSKWGDEYVAQAAKDLQWGHWDDLDFDAGVADIIVQLGIFGEVIYG